MYNKIILVGNLGRDPEMRYSPSGQAVTNFSIATSEKWTDQQGQPQERTLWWRISVWGKLAETCNQYLKKGRQVLVEGRMNGDAKTGGPRIYTRQDGTAGASFEVTAVSVKFLGTRADAGPTAGTAEVADMGEPPTEEGEIPF
ncbi:MAG: single-stranded DNA-binding protein [Chloroflexi bacterium]|nr:single-stranded DNA-binding protein [Chloroflexota bacterium]